MNLHPCAAMACTALAEPGHFLCHHHIDLLSTEMKELMAMSKSEAHRENCQRLAVLELALAEGHAAQVSDLPGQHDLGDDFLGLEAEPSHDASRETTTTRCHAQHSAGPGDSDSAKESIL